MPPSREGVFDPIDAQAEELLVPGICQLLGFSIQAGSKWVVK